MTDSSEQKTLNNVYGAMAALTIMTFIPVMSFAVIALLLFIVILIALYVVRAKAAKDSVVENHMTYLIRTIWIVQLIAIVTLTAATIYLLPNYSDAALQPCINDVVDMIISGATPDIAVMNDMIQPCMDNFMDENRSTFLTATAIGGGPLILYFLYRLFKGGSRALKGYRIANPKGWF